MAHFIMTSQGPMLVQGSMIVQIRQQPANPLAQLLGNYVARCSNCCKAANGSDGLCQSCRYIGRCNVCRVNIPQNGNSSCTDCQLKRTLGISPARANAIYPTSSSRICADPTCTKVATHHQYCKTCYNETKLCKNCHRSKRSGLSKNCAGCNSGTKVPYCRVCNNHAELNPKTFQYYAGCCKDHSRKARSLGHSTPRQ